MKHYLGSAWTAAKLCVFAAMTALLAGCMIVSEAELVADSEGAQVLPAKAYLTGYDEDGPNTWKVSDDGAQELALKGGTYSSPDGAVNARFVPLESVPGKYLLAIVGPDGSVYGVATYKNDIIVIDIILGDTDPLAVVKASGVPSLANLMANESGEGGLSLTTREQLDDVIQLHLDNKLALLGLVMYVSDDPKTDLPARIINDNGEYREE